MMQPLENKKQLVSENLIKALEGVAPDCVKRNVPMCDISWYKIGGIGAVVVEPDSTQSAAAVMRCLKEYNALYTVIGTASNILFDDAGYRGVLIKIADNNFNEISFEEDGIVRVGAGVWVPTYVRNVIKRGYEGCVHAIGIPGALGGLIIMNGGSLRKGIGEQLVDVTIIDKDGGIKILNQKDCVFGYRSSALQKMDCLVTCATFRYEHGNRDILRKQALDLLVERGKKFPRKLPSCGSVFLSYPEMYDIIGPPGKAIEDLGFKGKTQGGAQISPMHANFIVNIGGAKALDVLNLIHQCRAAIMERSGFDLKCEVRFLPSEGELCQAHIQADKLFKK
jgi:UDP-N-acetylmuramate dehydrogenase